MLKIDALLASWACGVTDPDAVDWATGVKAPLVATDPPPGYAAGLVAYGRYDGGTPTAAFGPARARAPFFPDGTVGQRLWQLLPVVHVGADTPMFASQDWFSPERVARLRGTSRRRLPPVRLLKSCEQLWIVDGHHRMTAARLDAVAGDGDVRVRATIWDQDAAARLERAVNPQLAGLLDATDADDWHRYASGAVAPAA